MEPSRLATTMTEVLEGLYHWSPLDRRELILKEGLVLFSEPTIASGTQPYISVSPTPSAAWGLSGNMGWANEIEDWDLWMVRLSANDEVRIRPNFGPVIEEVQLYNTIPPDRLWWVGSRSMPYPLPAKPQAAKRTLAVKAKTPRRTR